MSVPMMESTSSLPSSSLVSSSSPTASGSAATDAATSPTYPGQMMTSLSPILKSSSSPIHRTSPNGKSPTRKCCTFTNGDSIQYIDARDDHPSAAPYITLSQPPKHHQRLCSCITVTTAATTNGQIMNGHTSPKSPKNLSPKSPQNVSPKSPRTVLYPNPLMTEMYPPLNYSNSTIGLHKNYNSCIMNNNNNSDDQNELNSDYFGYPSTKLNSMRVDEDNFVNCKACHMNGCVPFPAPILEITSSPNHDLSTSIGPSSPLSSLSLSPLSLTTVNNNNNNHNSLRPPLMASYSQELYESNTVNSLGKPYRSISVNLPIKSATGMLASATLATTAPVIKKRIVRSHHGFFRKSIPTMPLVLALVLCLLNFFLPGTGTLLASISILFGCRTEYGSDKWKRAFVISFCISLTQMVTAIFVLGWVWSIMWGINFIKHSSTNGNSGQPHFFQGSYSQSHDNTFGDNV